MCRITVLDHIFLPSRRTIPSQIYEHTRDKNREAIISMIVSQCYYGNQIIVSQLCYSFNRKKNRIFLKRFVICIIDTSVSTRSHVMLFALENWQLELISLMGICKLTHHQDCSPLPPRQPIFSIYRNSVRARDR